MQPQALTIVSGTVLGVRTVTIEATPASDSQPARPAATWNEADVATDHARYDGNLVTGVTAVIAVVLDPGKDPVPGGGERVAFLVYPYATFRKYGSGPARKTVAHRYVASLDAPAVPGRVPVAA